MFALTSSFVLLSLALASSAQPIKQEAQRMPIAFGLHHQPFQTATTTLSSNLLLVGGYSGDLSVLSLDPSSGKLSNLTSTRRGGAGPSWATWDPSNDHDVYVVNDNAAANETNLHRFTWDGKTLSGVQPGNSRLEGTVHTRYSRQGSKRRCLLSAGYGAKAVSSQALGSDDDLRSTNATADAQLVFKYDFQGSGPNKERQDQSRPHEIIDSPDGKFVYVPDLGADQVHVFKYAESNTAGARHQDENNDGSECKLQPLPAVKVAPGDGPRHMAFYTASSSSTGTGSNALVSTSSHPSPATAANNATTYAYLVTELGGTIRSYTYNSTSGALNLIGPAQTTRTGITGNSTELANVAPSEPLISPDGRFVYVANRHLPHNSTAKAAKPSSHKKAGTSTTAAVPSAPAPNSIGHGGSDDSIALFTRNLTTGLLTGPIAQYSSGGRNPRHASLHSNGQWIAVANQGDDDATGSGLALLRRNETDGSLSEVMRWGNVSSPAFAGWWGSS